MATNSLRREWPWIRHLLVAGIVTVVVFVAIYLYVPNVAKLSPDEWILVYVTAGPTVFFGTLAFQERIPNIKRQRRIANETDLPLQRHIVSLTGWAWTMRVGFNEWESPPHDDRTPVSVDLGTGRFKPLRSRRDDAPPDSPFWWQYYRCLEVTTITNRSGSDQEVEIWARPANPTFGPEPKRLHLRIVPGRSTWSSPKDGTIEVAAPLGHYFVVRVRR